MNEPLPGQKTNIIAALFALVQAVGAAGVVDPTYVDIANKALALAVPVTLALKARRMQKAAAPA